MSHLTNNHYIYAFLEPDGSDIPRYIGQGIAYRYNWWKYTSGENQYGVRPWLIRLKATGKSPVVIMVAEKLSKKRADQYEIDLIEFIGRTSEGTGPLLNLSDGGEAGFTGHKHSKASKDKIAETQRIVQNRPDVKRRCSQAQVAANALEEVKKHKSASQLIAQNRPDVVARKSATMKARRERLI